ncbi:unnamed protein product, partial [Heligmosomoides polygyrus]|uniref:SCP domain-containing protein n=1 Tax=Heligmosomoides polygyrus TaxID=6339 RepID=A0A183GWJ4_HELPZ
IAWAKNHEFGCGVVNCNGTYNVVCNYTPGGSRLREVFYLQGEPCTMCPEEMTCDQTMGLCELLNGNTGAISAFLTISSLMLIKYLV